MIGCVEFFNNIKGWGIIKEESTEEKFFVHHSDIEDERFFPENKPDKFRTLSEGQNVTFDNEDKVHDGLYPKAKGVKII